MDHIKIAPRKFKNAKTVFSLKIFFVFFKGGGCSFCGDFVFFRGIFVFYRGKKIGGLFVFFRVIFEFLGEILL